MIITLGEKETFKYLVILEADTIKHAKMKEFFLKRYLWRTRNLLQTKLRSRNLIKEINTWAVRLVRYSGPFLKWNKEELQQMDARTRKLVTIHKALHLKRDTDCRCQENKEEEDLSAFKIVSMITDRTTQRLHKRAGRKTVYNH